MKKSNLQDWIIKSNLIHSNKYDYSESAYINSKSKIGIICNLHGYFEQVASEHALGKGCSKCKFEKLAKDRRLSTEDVLLKMNFVHNYKYTYPNFNYVNAHTKFEIVCDKHGTFFQNFDKHSNGSNCPKCSNIERGIKSAINNSISPMGWSSEKWKKQAIISKKFDSFKMYIIHCSNETEDFIKIGRTFSKIEDRFKGNKIPYTYSILIDYASTAEEIFKIEKELKRELKSNKYTPLNNFNGYSECFKIEDINSYINEIKDRLK